MGYICLTLGILFFISFVSTIVSIVRIFKRENKKKYIISSISFFLLSLLLGFLTVAALLMKSETNYSENVIRIQIDNLSVRLHRFQNDCGRYPTTEEGLGALIVKPNNLDCPKYPKIGYLEGDVIPKDENDKDFSYHSDGNSFELFTTDKNLKIIGTDKEKVHSIELRK